MGVAAPRARPYISYISTVSFERQSTVGNSYIVQYPSNAPPPPVSCAVGGGGRKSVNWPPSPLILSRRAGSPTQRGPGRGVPANCR